MQGKQIWQAALGDLETRVSRANFETWLRSTQIIELSDDVARIGAPNSFAADQLRSKFALDIQEALSLIVGHRVAVEFAVLNSTQTVDTGSQRGARPAGRKPAGKSSAPGSASPQQLELSGAPEHGLNPKYVFEKVVVGSNNR